MIQDYSDFCRELLESGFSMSGGEDRGIFTVIPLGWEAPASPLTRIRWFSADPEIDPWEWRMRVLEEREDIMYAKCFFGVGGFITRQWAERFLAVRRGGEVIEEAYDRGTVSRMAMRIYDAVREGGEVASHELKQRVRLAKEEKSAFDRALVELQMRMYLTIGGRRQKVSRAGEVYGWNSASFMTLEAFWGQRGLDLQDVDPKKAREDIWKRVYELNPDAQEKCVRRFIEGGK